MNMGLKKKPTDDVSRKNFYIRGKLVRRAGILATLLLITLSILTISPITSSSTIDNAEATATVSDTVLAMTTGHTSANVDLLVSSSNGTFAQSTTDDEAQFTVTTNNYKGYTLTIAGSNDTGTLTNSVTGTDTLESITTPTDEATFSANTTTAATNYNGKWGMKPSIYNSTANTNFLKAPTTTAETINTTAAANGTDASCTDPLTATCSTHQYSISVGARADYTKPTGIYTQTFTILAVANPVEYKVEYVDDTDSTYHMYQPSTGYGSLDGGDTATSVTLSTAITPPTKSGYTLLGWCDVATTDSGTTCSGNTYQLGDQVNYVNRTQDGASNTLVLHALWAQNVDITFLGGEILTGWEDQAIVFQGGSGWERKASGELALQTNTSYTLSFDYQASTATSGDLKVTLYDSGASTYDLSYTADTKTHHQEYTFASTNSKITGSEIYFYDESRTSTTPALTLTNVSISKPTIMVKPKGTQFATLPTNPTKTGFTFDGWYDNPSGTGTPITASSIVPNIATTYYAHWTKNTTGSLKVNYGANITNVKVCKVGGNCTGSDLIQTITASGTTISNLTYNDQYYLYPTFASGYMVDHWTTTGTLSGVFKATYSPNPAYWAGTGADTITLAAKSTANADMQTWTCPDNNAMAVGSTITLRDARDGEVYAVSKLADNKCWMIDNLRLDLVSVSETTLKGNTNATDAQITCLKNNNASGCSTASGTSQTAVSKTNWVNEYVKPYINVDSKDKVMYRDDTYGVGSGKVGVYYNYCSATAGSYCYPNNTGHDNVNATADICPTGWRMPTGGASGEYQALANAYSSNANNVKTALSTPLSGLFNAGLPYVQSFYGYFWSSTWQSTSYMYSLNVSPRYINPQNSNSRVLGFSVRCVRQ